MMDKIILPKIWPVACHTDQVGPGTTFVAVRGQQKDGLEFILLALQKGANKIVIDQDYHNLELEKLAASFRAELVLVKNTRQALSNLSAQAWGYPAQKLKIIGATGTKGKTTTVYAIRHILAANDQRVAMLSGVENMIGQDCYPASLTTPQPDYLHMFLAQCVAANIEYVVMEASAQAFSLNRLEDIIFYGVIFTNLELEHSEFYPDIETYFLAKCQILKQLYPAGWAILNGDDVWIQKIIARPREFYLQDLIKLIVFSQNQFNFNYYNLKLNNTSLQAGLSFELSYLDQASSQIKANFMFGRYNAYNLAGAFLAAAQAGIAKTSIALAISNFAGAPGRLEIYQLPNGARGVVDYAHTPSSFQNVLSLLRAQTNHLIAIFGAGGGRDTLKRPVIGQIATELCDVVILTNDNPRYEDPVLIAQQIIGTQPNSRFLIELDRAKAIALAYSLATPTSMIVVLGKGPDEYQQIGEQKTFFSDRQTLLSCQ